MTDTANYTALVAYIASVVPEIMELEVGCRFSVSEPTNELVHLPFGSGTYRVVQNEYRDGGAKFEIYFIKETPQLGSEKMETAYSRVLEQIKDIGCLKIIGRHITLDDVMKAMPSLNIKFTRVGDLLHIGQTGRKNVAIWRFGQSLEWHARIDPEVIEWLVPLFPISK